MPIIAVAGAFAGASALAAGGLTALGTIAAVGSIVGGIGAITGNKTLTKIGAVAGLVGGVGAFAQNQGWLASADAASVAGDTALSNTKALADTAGLGVESVAPTVDAGLGAAATSPIPSSAGEIVTQGLDTPSSALSQSITSPSTAMGAPSTGLMGAQAPTASSLTKPIVGGTTLPSAPAATGGNSIFEKLQGFSSFLDNNKQLSSMAATFIGGAFDSKKEAETEWMRTRAEIERQQMANGSDIPALGLHSSGKTVFNKRAPTYNGPRPTGLMNAR